MTHEQLPLERLKTEAERWIPAIASGELVHSAAAHDLRNLVQRAYDLGLARSETGTTPPWVEEELKDGDRICEAAGVQRTEGGRLPVAKIINAIKGRPVPPHRSGGPIAPAAEPSFSLPSAVAGMTVADAGHTPNEREVIRGLLHAMEMQEKRESGAYHIRQEVALAIWNQAKHFAERIISAPSSAQLPGNKLAREIEAQFPTQTPPDDYQFEFIFGVKLDYRDWRAVLSALRTPSAKEEKKP